jgi:C-5 cytosine-specific DNA methylase
MTKLILQLCADTGSDTYPYQIDSEYEVVLIGSSVGVENYHPPENVWGIVANPPCTEFSTARSSGKSRDLTTGMVLVRECQRIIQEANPTWWVIENPARGDLRKFLGEPNYTYQPWWFGSPWTKHTALWGNFVIPTREYLEWDDVPKNEALYTRPGRSKPSLVFMSKGYKRHIREFDVFDDPASDAEFRSTCSQGFAKAFKIANP